MKILVATFCMITAISCVADIWIDPATGNVWEYSVVDDCAEVSGGWLTDYYDVVIPSKINGYLIVGIADRAFEYKLGIGRITIPFGVTNIGYGAFYGCCELESVQIPASVLNIDNSAFECCSRLTSVECPVVRIGDSAFSGCTELNCVVLGNDVREIGEDAFFGCSALTSIQFPTSLRSIGSAAFAHCVGLTSVEISQGVTNVGFGAFGWCTNMVSFSVATGNTRYETYDGMLCEDQGKTLSIVPAGRSEVLWFPPGITTIGEFAFFGCVKVSSLVLPSTVKNIRTGAFRCMGLRNLTIPEGVADLKVRVLSSCTDLKTLVLPSSITNIEDYAFEESPLDKITFVGNAPVVAPKSFWQTYPTITVFKASSGWNVDKDGFWNGRKLVRIGLDAENAQDWVENYLAKEYHGVFETSDMYCKRFANWFGSDYANVSSKLTLKTGPHGESCFVWDDYVAGTDPTDPESRFVASVAMVNGVPVISYSPELSDAEKAKRVYKTLGKAKLTDADWTEVPSGSEADYNFFKVTVEMK